MSRGQTSEPVARAVESPTGIAGFNCTASFFGQSLTKTRRPVMPLALFLQLELKKYKKKNTSYSIYFFFHNSLTNLPTAGTLGLVHKVLLIIL